MLTEWYAWQFAENPNMAMDEDEEFDVDKVLAEINAEAEANAQAQDPTAWEDVF
jgi:hypothetical protein